MQRIALFALVASLAVGRAQEFQVILKITDEAKKAIPGATASLGAFVRHVPGVGFGEDIYTNLTATTDSEGKAVFSNTTPNPKIAYGVRPLNGYYRPGRMEHWFKSATNGHWQPWNPTLEIILRPIVKPVPMYARKAQTRIEQPAQRYGYDLMVGDWVAPKGKGQTADLFFELTGYAKSANDMDSTLVVSFPNPQDGIQSFVPPYNSAFRSPREAPLDGYQDKLQVRRAVKPEQLSPDWIDDTASEKNYFFRVRTVLDGQGRIKSALYGKIYGGFKFFGASSKGSHFSIRSYYLNPEPNSRNMEYDPAQNLSKDLKSDEEVGDP